MSKITKESIAIDLAHKAVHRNLNLFSEDELQKITESMLALLIDEYDENDMLAKSIIRMFYQLDNWHSHPLWATVINKFFGFSETKEKIEPKVYVEKTHQIVLENFKIDLPDITPTGQPTRGGYSKVAKPAKKNKPKKNKKVADGEEGESGSKVFKSIKKQKAEVAEKNAV